MSNDLERWLNLKIYIKADRPELLTGLNELLHLGLIGEAQVKSLARNHLTCPIQIKTKADIKPDLEKSAPAAIPKAKTHSQVNIINQIWQPFLAELSIRWLLFLGIFLVTISSGILAATQWDNLPVAIQYLILWAYTFSFWGIGFWLGRQDNLQLTAQTLKIIAILLVPINFWAMSSFSLTANLSGWMAIAFASLSLTTITYIEHKPQKNKIPVACLLLFLLLSYLHLGWRINSFPLLGIYIGLIAITITNYWLVLQQPRKYKLSNLLLLLATWSLLLIRDLAAVNSTQTLGLLLGISGWLLATIYLTKYRRILQRITAQKNSRRFKILAYSKLWQQISLVLLLVGWSIAAVKLQFAQITAIALLAIHVFSQRLLIYWRKRDLTAIFFIGLHSLFVVKELIPRQFRAKALHFSTIISQTEYFPESVFGVTLFPYLLLFVTLASWLYRRQKTQLAIYTEWLTFLFGLVLTCLSFSNPTWRTVNLLFSSLTLGYVAYIRQPLRMSLIYLTHGLGLCFIYSAIALCALAEPIALIFPQQGYLFWGILLLVGAGLEWTVLILSHHHRKTNFLYRQTWYDSSWYFGLILATISYTFLLANIDVQVTSVAIWRWGTIWLLTPLMLTAVARYTRSIKQRRLAVLLSCGGLILAQLLTFAQPESRFFSLAVATGLMFANAYYLRRTIVTQIHLGFILSLLASLLWSLISGGNWLILAAIAIIALVKTRQYLLEILTAPKMSYISQRKATGILGVGAEDKNYKLIKKYAQAMDFWAKAIAIVLLIALTIDYLYFAQSNQLILAKGQYLLTAILLFVATVLRYGKPASTQSWYVTAWVIELGVFGIIVFLGGAGFAIAVANIIFGILAAWLMYSAAIPLAIPLIYTLLGILWRLPYLTASTGWLTLGAAITGIMVHNHRQGNNKTLGYISLAGISLGIYELIIYQMSRSSGGSIADALTILALVAAAIAFVYRLTAWWQGQNSVVAHHERVEVDGEMGRWGDGENAVITRQRQQLLFNFNLSKIILVAHIHWAIASILKIIAAGIAIEFTTPRLTLLSIAVSFFLGIYALIQGRDTTITADESTTTNDWWVYVGLAEIAATIVYTRLIIDKLSLFDPWRVIFTIAIALIIYQIPWHNFGWKTTPWRRTALIIPALMALVTAETISYFSLIATAAFYLRIAYHQQNIRWSYISLGFIDWGVARLVWQSNLEAIWFAAIISLSILYIAQFDPDLQQNRKYRHYLRLVGSGFLCLVALFYQDTGIIPTVISLITIMAGLGLRIRAFLFVGTITFIVTAIYQLVILVFTYSFLKWIVGLVMGIMLIIVAANFERQRDRLNNQLQSYTDRLKQWD